jgi:hypothetical protein
VARRRTSNEPDGAKADFEVHVNWKLNLIVLGVAVATFAGIRVLESLARAETSSLIACYVGLTSDVTSLINSADTAATSADCFALPPRRLSSEP